MTLTDGLFVFIRDVNHHLYATQSVWQRVVLGSDGLIGGALTITFTLSVIEGLFAFRRLAQARLYQTADPERISTVQPFMSEHAKLPSPEVNNSCSCHWVQYAMA